MAAEIRRPIHSLFANIRKQARVFVGSIGPIAALLLVVGMVFCAPASAQSTTTISGTVYAPNGVDPLVNVLVYATTASVSLPVAGANCPGVSCQTAANAIPSGVTLYAYSAVNGSFTLSNIPISTAYTLVIQAGKWQRQFLDVEVGTSALTALELAMPTVHGTINTGSITSALPAAQTSGTRTTVNTIPLIAISTGSQDAMECVLRDVGIADAQFTDDTTATATTGGRIHLYQGDESAGAYITTATPSETTLMAGTSTTPLNDYDMAMFPCQGKTTAESAVGIANLIAYASAGGRVFATHDSLIWLNTITAVPAGSFMGNTFSGAVNWISGTTTNPGDGPATINTGFTDGSTLAQWMLGVGASTTSGQVALSTLRNNISSVIAPTQAWVTLNAPSDIMQVTFNTPVGAAAAAQYGRVLFNEYHVEEGSQHVAFPGECGAVLTPSTMSAQEKMLEYSLFDLSGFVTAVVPPSASISITTNPSNGNFNEGDTADTITANVLNTSSTVALPANTIFTITLPAGVTATAMTDSTGGWSCTVGTLTCTRSVTLAASTSDPVTVTVSVSSTATGGTASTSGTVSAQVASTNFSSNVSSPITITLVQAAAVSWATPAAITYGMALSTTQLDAVGNAPSGSGTYAYTPLTGVVLSAGSQTLSVVYTPGSAYTSTYPGTGTASVTLVVNPAAATVTLSGLTQNFTGLPAVVSSTTNPASLPVTYTYTGINPTIYGPSSTPPVAAGSYTVVATIASGQNYAGTASGTLVISASAPDATSTSVFVLPSGLVVGTPVAITATVADVTNSGTTPTGSVTLTDTLGATVTPLNGGNPVPLVSGLATLSGVALSGIGQHTITATYAAVTGFQASSNTATVAVAATSSPVGTAASSFPVTVTITAAGTPANISVVTEGATGLDFTDAVMGDTCISNPPTVGQTCTVNVNFTPKYAGPRYGAVVITDVSGDVLGTAYLQGTGTGPQMAFNPGTQTTLPNSAAGIPFSEIASVRTDASRNLYIADVSNFRIVKMPWTGTGYGTPIAIPLTGQFYNYADGAVVDGAGNLLVISYSKLVELPWDGSGYGAPVVLLGGLNPGGVAVDGAGNAYVSDYAVNTVTEVPRTASGYGSPAVLFSGLSSPLGLSVDGTGNVYIANLGTSTVLEMPWTGSGYGAPITVGSNLTDPEDVAVDAAGDVYIADSGNSRAVMVPWTASGFGTQTVVPFTGISPRGIALDELGNVFTSNGNTVVELDVSDPPSLSFASTTLGVTSSDSPQTVTVMNDGNAPLTFTGLSYPTDFPEVNGALGACSASAPLAAGTACALPVDFTPAITTTPGALSESLVLTDNNQNAITLPGTQQTIVLGGTAIAILDSTSTALQVNPSVVTAGSPVTILATVTDTNNSGTVPTGSVTLTDTLGTTVTPLNGGNAVPLVSGVATLSSVTLSGVGQHIITVIYAGVLGFQASSSTATATVDISSPVGTLTSSFPVTLTFTAGGTLGNIQVLTQGAPNLDFTDAVTGDTCSVGTNYSAGATCVVNVIFTPKYAGPRYGAVVLEDGSGNLLASAYVNGLGIGPQITFANTTLSTFAPNSISTLGGNFAFSSPTGIAVDASGNVFVADATHQAVEEIPAGCVLSACVTTLGGGFQFGGPYGVAVDGAGNLFVSDNGNHAVYELLAVGGYTTVNSLGTSTSNNNPKGIALDGAGNVYLSGSNNGVYEIFAASGYTTASPLGGNFLNPGGLAVDGAGNVYVADSNNSAVKEMPSGCASSACVTQLISLGYPPGLAIDVAGDVYIGLNEYLAGSSYQTSNNLDTDSSNVSSVAVAANGNIFIANGTSVEEYDYADAPSFTYPTSTLVGARDSTDGRQRVTVSNVGNTALIFSSIAYPADFSQPSGASHACSVSAQLAIGTNCPLPILFTPTQAGSPLSESLVLTDNDISGTTAIQSISLSGTGLPVPTATTLLTSTVLTANHAAAAFTPVSGTGGTAPLTYSVSPGLPAGLALNTGTGAITGTPTAASAAVSYTVTVTDANAATATANFSLTVNAAVAATQAVASTVLTQNHAATTFTPVTGTGGTAPLTYSVSPGLPAGLALNPITGAITGTPTGMIVASSYTVTVTDANAATATANFSLTVNAAVVATQAVASTVLTQNHAATTFTPVTGTGGTAPLTYSVSPGLPAGLALNTNTGAITGTPTGTSTASSYTVTATDANAATATANFSLTVNAAVVATQAVASTVLTQNHAATTFTPVTGSGGTAPLTYSVSPGLPAGLMFDPSTGAITGTSTVASAAVSYTVTVTDANAATATANFSLTVNAAVAATRAVASTVLTQNHAATTFTPVTGMGGTAPLAYSVSPGLPPGLTFNANTGAITGTPTSARAASSYTVTVTDANGATATASFNLTVDSAVVATQTIASTTLTQNRAAVGFMPVAGSGGDAPLTYSVSPGLPAGLVFNTSMGAITGTPTSTSAASSYTVTVTDANGETATASFSLTVNAAVAATQAVASTVLTANHAAILFTPVTGAGGTAPLAYSVSPGLPAGLVLNAITGAITGTPTSASAALSYTVTVTDTNGATATANFSLTVDSVVLAVQAIRAKELTFYQVTTPFTPVTGSGGTAPLTYSVLPVLPAGLVLNTSTGVISGTPAVVSVAASYTVTVTDINGETAQASFSLGAAQQASMTVVSANPTTATPVQSVTLSATVASTLVGTPMTPSGTVTFFNGSTQLGVAVPLAGGTAQLVVPSLPPGQTAMITAVYSGDGNFLGGTSGNSASVVVGPLDFTFTNAGTNAYTAAPGAVASYSFALAPLYSSYAGPVSFTVTGLPAGATASFTPSSVAADGGSVPVQMTVQTLSTLAHNGKSGNSPFGRGIVLALLLLPFGMKRRVREKLKGRMLLLVLLLAGATAAVSGCASNNGFMLQSPQTYTLTVTATSGTLQHSQTVTLIVQ
jgi:sugar lactone lactonase YvrE